MKIEYDLDGAGWAWLKLKYKDKEYNGHPSYLSDPLRGIANGLVEMVYEQPFKNRYRENFMIKIHWEPDVDEITFLNNRGNLNVKVKNNSQEEIFSGRCRLDDFIKDFVLVMEKLLLKHGLVGYQNDWINNEFPVSGLIKLKDYLADSNELESSTTKGLYGGEVEISNFEKELILLNKLISQADGR